MAELISVHLTSGSVRVHAGYMKNLFVNLSGELRVKRHLEEMQLSLVLSPSRVRQVSEERHRAVQGEPRKPADQSGNT